MHIITEGNKGVVFSCEGGMRAGEIYQVFDRFLIIPNPPGKKIVTTNILEGLDHLQKCQRSPAGGFNISLGFCENNVEKYGIVGKE